MEVSKSDLEALSALRLQEAKLLLDNKKYSGAYYLAGYSVELALKACIAKNFRSGVLPDKRFVLSIHTHKLEDLVAVAKLKNDMERIIAINSRFAGNWGRVKEWNEEARYEIWDIVAATELFEAISDSADGVLQWLKKHY